MQVTDPAAHGFDARRLAATAEFVDRTYVASGKLPHAQLLIARDGEVVHFSNHGEARAGQPLADDTLFRIASMTKPITSIAFMTLVEQARVALDTPVHHVLPELKDIGVFAGGGGQVPFATRPTAEPMRMVDLLRHTSGLTYGFQNRSNVDAAYRASEMEKWFGGHDLEGFVRALAEIPLEFSPGEQWNYSVSTDVLGAVIQRLADKPLAEVLDDRVCRPLGMADTFFHVPADKLDRLADAYSMTPNGRKLSDPGATSLWGGPPTLVSGGGGLVSTSADYHRFCRMCLNGGELDGARIVGRKTLELMTRNHLPGGADLSVMSKSMFSETTNAGTGFGLGFAVTIDPVRSMLPGSVGEYYWGGIYSTAFFIDPVERLHMVFMTQLSPSSTYPIRRELKTLIYSALT